MLEVGLAGTRLKLRLAAAVVIKAMRELIFSGFKIPSYCSLLKTNLFLPSSKSKELRLCTTLMSQFYSAKHMVPSQCRKILTFD